MGDMSCKPYLPLLQADELLLLHEELAITGITLTPPVSRGLTDNHNIPHV